MLTACALPTDAPPEPATRRVAAYRVAEGDTLSTIADELGLRGGWRALAELNHLADPDRIRAESYLQLPLSADDALARGLPVLSLPAPYRSELAACPSAGPLPTIELADSMLVPRHHAECVLAPDGEWLCALIDRHGDSAFVRHGERLAGAEPEDALEVARAGLLSPMPDGSTLPLTWGATAADLDGDSERELVVTYVAERHRLGELWNVLVIDGDRPPLAFQTETPIEALLVDAGDGRCELLATTWEWMADLDRAPGSYLVARQYRYQAGELVAGAVVANSETQVLSRRWEDESAPGVTLDDAHLQVVAAFDDPRATLRDDPALALDVVERQRGRVIAVEVDELGDEGLSFELSFGGPPMRYRSLAASASLLVDEGVDEETRYTGIGWRGQPHLLPASYRPSDPSAWIGREVTIETRVDVDGAELVRYVWLDPPATGD